MSTGLDGASIDGHWYTAMLHIATDTPWLHGFLLTYTNYGLVLFALLLLAGFALGALVGCTGLAARSLLANPVRRLRGGRLAPLLGSLDEPVSTGVGR
ncbi:MAG: hypothetical protein ACRDQ5_11425 [Sciscionella sp.]